MGYGKFVSICISIGVLSTGETDEGFKFWPYWMSFLEFVVRECVTGLELITTSNVTGASALAVWSKASVKQTS
jgi:hypothetical protein